MKKEPEHPFANRIKYLRLSQALSQGQLAKALAISTNYVSMLERGATNASQAIAQKYASYFNVDIEWLLCKDITQLDIQWQESNIKNLTNQYDARSNILSRGINMDQINAHAVLLLLLQTLSYQNEDDEFFSPYEVVEKITEISKEVLIKESSIPYGRFHSEDCTSVLKKVYEIKTAYDDPDYWECLVTVEKELSDALTFIKHSVLFGMAQREIENLQRLMPGREFKIIEDEAYYPGIVATYRSCNDLKVVYFDQETARLSFPNGRVPSDCLLNSLKAVLANERHLDTIVLYATDRRTWAQVQVIGNDKADEFRGHAMWGYVAFCDRFGHEPDLFWEIFPVDY